MERFHQRLISAEKAVSTFGQIAGLKEPSDIERDAAIQRFEYSFEACWKTAEQYLYDIEGLDIGSPKGVIRCCRDVKLFNDKETVTALNMVNDRNLTTHTYNESVAEKIYADIETYYHLLKQWVGRMNQRAA
ncbi:HI0074 family nucleotidyltransferase substrate-binding subunit [Salibacterium qingdaonense]|uniref:Nucleotidyltransferase substrate binding protein, HI0074 family n=1 Tax=Salibacterium qingdaonense TaxID=266892 RepID=A0A1I4KJ03_9BACI|nr:HI0074 family nucleotidyltransferase substrate-binding subunit [Salibacterium qingdaonense]SFL78407.1 nucleotidyltransferase substrate binding protein, HI0074 family [Salibacterium qingdaonense]